MINKMFEDQDTAMIRKLKALQKVWRYWYQITLVLFTKTQRACSTELMLECLVTKWVTFVINTEQPYLGTQTQLDKMFSKQ